MRRTLLAATIAFALPFSAAAQDPASSGIRFGQDILAPLLIDTIQMVESGRLVSDPRPEGPLPRARRCHAVIAKAAEYRRLGLLPQGETAFGETQRGASSALGRPIRDDMIRALLDRCRREAEDVCRRTGDVNAVLEATQAMAVIRTVFADADIGRRSGEPALTGAFRREIGDSDQDWMRRTLDECGRFELSWQSRHRHQCRMPTAPWRQNVMQRFEVKASVAAFNAADDSSGGVMGATLSFEVIPQRAQVSGEGPGRQSGGLIFSYDGLSTTRDGEVRIMQFEIGDEGRLEKLIVRFGPPMVIEDAVVTMPRLGKVNNRHDHWREGFLSAHARLRSGDMIEIGDFFGSGGSYRTEINGQGTVLRETEGCVPYDNSTFELKHVGR